MDQIDSACGRATAVRRPLERLDRDRVGYGSWRIDLDPSPPVPGGAWVWWHVKHEHLEGREHSFQDALDECDRLEDENAVEDTAPCISCGKMHGYACYTRHPSNGETRS